MISAGRCDRISSGIISQANVGHYGVFSGKRWEREIYPVVRAQILATE